MYKRLNCIGDVHTRMERVRDAYISDPDVLNVVVGDVGVGLMPIEEISATFSKPNLRFIRGNHDKKQDCVLLGSWIPDGTWLEDSGVMFIGGARSIDKYALTAGVNWWPDEEYEPAEAQALVELYKQRRPRIMITHDLPRSVATYMCRRLKKRRIYLNSVVDIMLDEMLAFHRPERWVCGHWHWSYTARLKGTRFDVLNIGEALQIDL